jgi:hypothetical protein
MSDTLTVLIQVETLLASLMLTGFIFTSLGHLVLPVVFVFDFSAGSTLERSMSEFSFNALWMAWG